MLKLLASSPFIAQITFLSEEYTSINKSTIPSLTVILSEPIICGGD